MSAMRLRTWALAAGLMVAAATASEAQVSIMLGGPSRGVTFGQPTAGYAPYGYGYGAPGYSTPGYGYVTPGYGYSSGYSGYRQTTTTNYVTPGYPGTVTRSVTRGVAPGYAYPGYGYAPVYPGVRGYRGYGVVPGRGFGRMFRGR